jgi:hypothetical protein
MADGKIELSIGAIKFAGEGDTKWLTEQLDKLLSKAEALVKIAPPIEKNSGSANSGSSPGAGNKSEIAKKALGSFLKDTGSTTNQTKKFLATAIWVSEKEGKQKIQTSDVTGALKNASQTRIGNASDALNKNCNKGYCEKDGKDFFVTQEGRESLSA